MNVVVADTSPLNYLVLIDAIQVLPSLFSQAIIPEAVFAELRHEKTPASVIAWSDTLPEWAEVRRAEQLDSGLNLGAGEKEALALARELRVPVLMDERKGRNAAKRLGLLIVGTLNILEEAAVAGFLDIDEALAKLEQTSFRGSTALVGAVRRRVRLRLSAT